MADITIEGLTNGTNSNDGTGVFDKLMKSAEMHIKQEYDCGRITGNDYSTVYLGAMQSVLSESVKFILGEQAADKQAELLSAQAENIGSERQQNRLLAIAKLEKESGYEVTHDIQGEISAFVSDTDGLIDSKYRENEKRIELLESQRVGLKTDTKQKLLKQLFEGYAINTTTTGSVTSAPSSSAGVAIDRVANDILDDLGSSVNV